MGKLKRKWWSRFIKLEREALDDHVDDAYHYDKYVKSLKTKEMDIRIYYLPPDCTSEIEMKLKRYSKEWRNAIMRHPFVRIFDLHTFITEFNEDHISDQGWILTLNKDEK